MGSMDVVVIGDVYDVDGDTVYSCHKSILYNLIHLCMCVRVFCVLTVKRKLIAEACNAVAEEVGGGIRNYRHG